MFREKREGKGRRRVRGSNREGSREDNGGMEAVEIRVGTWVGLGIGVGDGIGMDVMQYIADGLPKVF